MMEEVTDQGHWPGEGTSVSLTTLQLKSMPLLSQCLPMHHLLQFHDRVKGEHYYPLRRGCTSGWFRHMVRINRALHWVSSWGSPRPLACCRLHCVYCVGFQRPMRSQVFSWKSGFLFSISGLKNDTMLQPWWLRLFLIMHPPCDQWWHLAEREACPCRVMLKGLCKHPTALRSLPGFATHHYNTFCHYVFIR